MSEIQVREDSSIHSHNPQDDYLEIDSQEGEQDDEYPEGGMRAYLVLIGSFIGLIANFGMLNSVGAIQTYISMNQLASVKSLTVSWIFSIYFALAYFGGIVVGPFFDVRGATIPLVGGLILIVGGFIAVANCSLVWQFILSLSLCVGIGNALCITPLVGVISHWFYLKRGRAIGLATTGGSVGGIIIPLMLRGLYPKVGFSWAIRILALFSLVCMVISIVLAKGRLSLVQREKSKEKSARTTKTKRSSPGNSELPDKASSVITTTTPPLTPTDNISMHTLSENRHESSPANKFKNLIGGKDVRYFNFANLLDVKYSLLIAGVFTEELSLMLIVTYFASYAITQNVSESNSYLLLTVFNAAGVPGRWLPGYASDIIGHFNVMILMLVGLCLSIFLLWLPFGSSHSVLWAFSVLGGFFSSSILSLTPVCLGQITPVSKFGERYGMLYFFVSIGNLFGLPIGAAIIGSGSKHNYDMFVVLCGVLAVVGSLCWLGSRYCIAGLQWNIKV